MASPQTIPQVVEVDEARAPPSFGPRSRSIVLLLSAACLAAQSDGRRNHFGSSAKSSRNRRSSS